MVQAGATRKSEIGGGGRMGCVGVCQGFAGYGRLRLRRGAVTSRGVQGVWRELAVTHDKSRGSAMGVD